MFEAQATMRREPGKAEEKFYGKYPGIVLPQQATATEGGDYSGELWVQVPGIMEEDPSGGGGSSGEDSQQSRPLYRPIEVLARPCLPPGFFFVPEPDSQVWVEFAGGDLNCAIWTGVWYPPKAKDEKNRSPRTVAGQPPKRPNKIIRTVSGHVVQFDDTENEEKIVILHKDGMTTIEVSSDESITISCKTLTITGDVNVQGSIKVGSSPYTTITGNEIKGEEA